MTPFGVGSDAEEEFDKKGWPSDKGIKVIRERSALMNIYKFELPWGIAVVCAEDKEEAIDIFWNGDGRKEELCGKEYFNNKNVIGDDEPFLINISKSHIIAFHCG